MTALPRIVVAGTSSGAGKTSVACGLIGALRARGLVVQGFKVGPDYIDPGYHALASGRPGRNLDAFLSGPELIAPLALLGAAGADVAVVEGVMGLFDGASGRGELASTAHVAKLLGAPVLLVLDASSMARSAAAVVHGYMTFDREVQIAGVIVNKVGSERRSSRSACRSSARCVATTASRPPSATSGSCRPASTRRARGLRSTRSARRCSRGSTSTWCWPSRAARRH